MKISEFCLLNGTSLKKNEGKEGYLYLDTANITNGVIDSFQKYGFYEELPSRARRKVSNNSIVYSTVRPNQQHFGIITEPPDNLIVSTGFCVIDVDEKIADPRYVYYYLSQSSITKKLHAIAEQATTAYPSIKAKDLGDLEIDLPDLDRQHEVAQILTSLDKKILLNSAINDNLYTVLEAVYQEKFTKPKSESKIGILSDICFYANDKIDVSKLDTRSYFSTENMLPEKKGASNATQLPTVSKVTACSRGDTLISNIRPYFKKIVYSEIKCGCSNDVLCFSPKSQKYSSYLFSTLFDDAFFAFMTAGSKGTKMPRGDKVQIMTYPVKLPADNEVEAFNTVAIPILKQIHSNNMENRELASLRDSLLKTLLSDATK